MKKIVLTYGLISGLLLSIFLAAPFYVLGPDRVPHSFTYGYATMVLSMLLIYFGVRQYRDTVGGGRIGFWKACQVGFLIFTITGLCYVITWDLLYRGPAANFIADYNAQMLAQARASGATEAQLAVQQTEAAKFAELYQNTFIRAGMTFLEPLPVGIVLTLVTAGLLGRKPRPEAA